MTNGSTSKDFPNLFDLITDVRIRILPNSTSETVAFASIVIAGQFVCHDLSIVKGSKGLFISMPQRQDDDGEYCDRFTPFTADARTGLQTRVLKAYEEATKVARNNRCGQG